MASCDGSQYAASSNQRFTKTNTSILNELYMLVLDGASSREQWGVVTFYFDTRKKCWNTLRFRIVVQPETNPNIAPKWSRKLKWLADNNNVTITCGSILPCLYYFRLYLLHFFFILFFFHVDRERNYSYSKVCTVLLLTQPYYKDWLSVSLVLG